MSTHATVRVIYFDLNYNGNNYCVLLNIDDYTTYVNKTNWLPPSLDDDLCYSTSEEFLINFDILGERDYKGKTSIEIAIIDG